MIFAPDSGITTDFTPESDVLAIGFSGGQKERTVGEQAQLNFLNFGFPCKKVSFHNLSSAWINGAIGEDEEFEPLLLKLQEVVRTQGINKIVTIGPSGGGYWAILFGMLLNADAVIAFSPITRVRKPIAEKIKSLNPEKYENYETCGYLNLEKFIRITNKKQETISKVFVIYGKNNPRDSAEIKRLENYPNLLIKPLETDEHQLIPYLVKRGMFRRMINLLATFDLDLERMEKRLNALESKLLTSEIKQVEPSQSQAQEQLSLT